MKYAIVLLLVLVSGCGLFERKPDAPIVVQPKCLGKKPVKPNYMFDSLPKATTDAEAALAVQTLRLDFLSADKYGLDWETAASGCQ